jgi:O-phospho-L-seryl-tRNASec:L-selenocysteinyl-tRNA synthase
MDAANLAHASALIGPAYAQQGGASLARRAALVRQLLTQRSIPDEPWDEPAIEAFLSELAAMDSNNFAGAVGAGEREARIFSALVRRRHFGLGHGVGRSGDVASVQPKAAGSSLLYKLANRLALHAARACGLARTQQCIVLPLATGASVALVLQTLRAGALAARRAAAVAAPAPASAPSMAGEAAAAALANSIPGPTDADAAAPAASQPDARFVIWPRIDQKSCFKSIIAAGLEPVVVEMTRRKRRRDAPSVATLNAAPTTVPVSAATADEGDDGVLVDELRTDVDAILAAIRRLGAANIVCVMTTTTCFAPRAPDDVVAVAKL